MRRPRARDISPVLEIQRLAVMSRRQELAEAMARESQCAAETIAADRKAAAAFDDWQACLAGRGFDPTALAGLAGRLTACDSELRQRRADETRAGERLKEARVRLAEADAQASQTEKLLARLRRRQRRESEDRRHAILEDRISYDWVMR